MPHHEKEHQCCYHQRQRGGQSKQIEIASLLDRLAEEKDRKDCDHDADEVTLEILETVDLKPARQRHSFVHKHRCRPSPITSATIAMRKTSTASISPTASAFPDLSSNPPCLTALKMIRQRQFRVTGSACGATSRTRPCAVTGSSVRLTVICGSGGADLSSCAGTSKTASRPSCRASRTIICPAWTTVPARGPTSVITPGASASSSVKLTRSCAAFSCASAEST